MGSPRSDAQGTVSDGGEREFSDVTGTPRPSDTVQQGVDVDVSFTITRAPATSVQGWQEGNQGVLQMILAELQATGQRQAEMPPRAKEQGKGPRQQASVRFSLLPGYWVPPFPSATLN